jgi:hypothetical protein
MNINTSINQAHGHERNGRLLVLISWSLSISQTRRNSTLQCENRMRSNARMRFVPAVLATALKCSTAKAGAPGSTKCLTHHHINHAWVGQHPAQEEVGWHRARAG